MKNEYFGPLRRWRKQDWTHWDTAKRVIQYCGEKIVYHSVAEAEEMRVRQEEKTRKELRIYSCSSGDHFHLTSQVPY